MRGDIVLGLLVLPIIVSLVVLWLVMRPAKPREPQHDDLRRADDGAEKGPGEGLGSASYWPTN